MSLMRIHHPKLRNITQVLSFNVFIAVNGTNFSIFIKLQCYRTIKAHYVYLIVAPYQAIVDVCDETKDDAGSLSLDVDCGIVRSHHKYPWQYSSNSYSKFSKMFPRYVCKKTLWMTKTKTNLLVTIKAVDVNDGDFLNITSATMGDEVNTETITTNINKVFYERKYVEFTFSILQGTNGGKGFLICFKSKMLLY